MSETGGELSPEVRRRLTIEGVFINRNIDLIEWIREHAPYCLEGAKHADKESEAHAYWRYGYAQAMSDALAVMREYDGLPPVDDAEKDPPSDARKKVALERGDLGVRIRHE